MVDGWFKMCGECVVDGWFKIPVFGRWLVSAASPGPSQTDWTLGSDEAAHLGGIDKSVHKGYVSAEHLL